MSTIEQIERHAKRIASGRHKTVRPGLPVRISDAAQPGDGVWQGDLGIEIVQSVPSDYVRCDNPFVQLVPGSTQGARHCIDSLDGVQMWLPDPWQSESLRGPCLVLTEERTVEHPTHGAVTIPAGFTVLCRYQREYDAELRRARRNAD